MDENKVIALEKPGAEISDALTAVLRKGACQMLARAIEAEAAAFLAEYEDLKDEDGRRLVGRNGYLPERTLQSGRGPSPQSSYDKHAAGVAKRNQNGALCRNRLPLNHVFVVSHDCEASLRLLKR